MPSNRSWNQGSNSSSAVQSQLDAGALQHQDTPDDHYKEIEVAAKLLKWVEVIGLVKS